MSVTGVSQQAASGLAKRFTTHLLTTHLLSFESMNLNFHQLVLPPQMVLAVGGILLGLVLLLLLLRLRRRPQAVVQQQDLRIDVSALPDAGPPPPGPRLEYYNLPVRLAVLVLAPVGRSGVIPEENRLPRIFEQLMPGLMEVISAHQPLFRRWPPQVSTQGFAQAIFSNVPLPGDRGKGTPWCGIAGKFEADGKQYLAAMFCRTEKANSLSQVFVQRPGGWFDVLRVYN